jgi:hypothetical protein
MLNITRFSYLRISPVVRRVGPSCWSVVPYCVRRFSSYHSSLRGLAFVSLISFRCWLLRESESERERERE